MSSLPCEYELEEDTGYSSNNVLRFPSMYTGYNTNPFPLPTNITEGLAAYVNSIVYNILYQEKILRHLSQNNSFDSIVFSDLGIDTVQSNILFGKVANTIEDLSDSVDFD